MPQYCSPRAQGGARLVPRVLGRRAPVFCGDVPPCFGETCPRVLGRRAPVFLGDVPRVLGRRAPCFWETCPRVLGRRAPCFGETIITTSHCYRKDCSYWTFKKTLRGLHTQPRVCEA